MLTLGLTALGGLLATWLAYPAVVRIAGAFRSMPVPPASGPAETVSVIVASRADAAAIRSRVLGLLHTIYPADRLEVVVGLDSDGTDAGAVAAICRGLGDGVVVVPADSPGGKAAALNAAVRAARHEILVFADTAQRFEPATIPELVTVLRDPTVGAVSGMLEMPLSGGRVTPGDLYWRFERWLRFWESRVHSTVGVTGAIYAMRRSAWRPLPAGLILDDLYVPMRLVLAGWRIAFTRSARAHDFRRFTPAEEFQRKVRTLTGVIQVCAWLPSVLSPFRNPIWLQFVFHKIFRLLTPYLAVLTVIGLAGSAIRTGVVNPARVSWLIIVCGVAGAICFIPRVRRAVRMQLAWGMALQGSAAVATYNGLRGRWDVWR